MARFWRWIMPGLHIKRWLLLFAAGVFLMGLGLSVLWEGRRLYGDVEQFLSSQVLRGAEGLRIPLALAGILVVLVGAVAAALATYRVIRSLLDTLFPQAGAARQFFQRRQLFRGPRVVALGGGTGIPNLLRGLKEYTANLAAVVTVADDGGSSGRLSSEFGILPPGDIRNCLLALADTEPLMERLFQHRFQSGNGLSGHSFGNLFILAMAQTTGDFYDAIRSASQVLAVRGRVMPSTLQHVSLEAELENGQVLRGESAISRAPAPVRRVTLTPADALPLPEALAELAEADIIVLGPGSLYTSVIPNLLVPGVAETIRRSPAVKFYVCNIMTQPGETDGYTAADHVRAIAEHTRHGLIDICVVNTGKVPTAALDRYREQGAHPVAIDFAELSRLGVEVLRADILEGGELVRHHPGKLAAAILTTAAGRITRRGRSPWDLLWLRQRLKESAASQNLS